ncbi:MAG: TonB-dependent receptor [Bacteroides sp.]|nr:TonB-dependent receptor [Bacteroides sp.]
MNWSEKWLDELSLRASYGINGSRPKYDFTHVGIYNVYDYPYLGESGTYLYNLEQINLRWERTTQQNVGLNFAAFNNRINVDLEFYKKTNQ